MYNWEDLFRSHILARGRAYCEEGAVTFIEKTDFGYRAEVEGTENYEVTIEIQDDVIRDMDCSCPYAAEGNYCKHMAAVFCAIEAEEQGNGGQKDPIEKLMEARRKRTEEIQKLVERIPEKELRSLVVSLTNQDESLYNRLMTQYAAVSPATLARLKEQIDHIGWQFSGRSGFVDYRNAMDYTDALSAVLHENVPQLIRRNYLKEAFEITNYVFHEIGNRDMDDSDGSSIYVADSCYEYWKKILEAGDKELEKYMICWFQDHQEGYVIDHMQESIETFLVNEFHDEDLIKEKIREIDEQMEELDRKMDKESWKYRHQYPSCILTRIGLMERLGCRQEEIRDYKERYRQFPEIREIMIREALEAGEYKEAEREIKESREIDSQSLRLVERYTSLLMDIYIKMDRPNEYKTELIRHIFECGESSLENLLKLKEICTEQEWNRFREKILVSERLRGIRCALLEHEKMYELLIQEVQANGSIYLLDKYEKVLKKRFPDEVRKMYTGYVRKQAESASHRKAYKGLMKYLKKLRRYPGGKEVAEQIAVEWKNTYKRRSAMLDELRKAGF